MWRSRASSNWRSTSSDDVAVARCERRTRSPVRSGRDERIERGAALAERLLEQVAPGMVKQVERDEHDGDLGQELLRGPHPSQPGLERGEVEHRSLAPGDELAVDDERRLVRQRARRLHDLGERPRHVVEVAAEQPRRPARLEVELGADAVVLVLDPGLVADSAHHLVGVGHGRCEHESDRSPDVQRCVRQPSLARQRRRLADLAGEHVRASNRLRLGVEGRRDRLFQQALPQADAGLARRDASDESRLLGRRSTVQIGHQRDALGRRAGGRDRGKARRDVGDGQARPDRRSVTRSAAASPKSEWRRYAARRASSPAPLAAESAAPCCTQPRPSFAVTVDERATGEEDRRGAEGRRAAAREGRRRAGRASRSCCASRRRRRPSRPARRRGSTAGASVQSRQPLLAEA